MSREYILGFKQQVACDLGLQVQDLHFLIWFRDFAPFMISIKEDADVYYWVNCGKFICDYKILNIKPDSVRKSIIKRLLDADVLKKKLVNNCEELKGKQKGFATFYSFSSNYEKLLGSPNQGYKYTDEQGEKTEVKQGKKTIACKKIEVEKPQNFLQYPRQNYPKDNYPMDKNAVNSTVSIYSKDIYIIERDKREGWEPLLKVVPNLVVDSAYNETLDLNMLIKAYSKSDFLKQTIFHTSKIISLYDKIITGYYDSFLNQSVDHSHNYSEQDIAKLVEVQTDFNNLNI